MTVGVDADLRIREYPGDDSATARPVPFKFLAADDLKVTRVNADGSETVLVRGTDFTVAGAGNSEGGSVTPLAPIATGTLWRIEGEMALDQPTDYTAGDDFPAESHERGLDRSMIAHQEARRDINDTQLRSLMLRRGEVSGLLPKLSDLLGKFLSWNADGDPYGAAGTGNDPAFRADMADSDPLKGASLVNYRGRSQARKNADAPSMLDYVPPGQHAAIFAGTSDYDATGDFHDAFAELDGTGLTLLVPGAKYRVGELVIDGSNYTISSKGVWLHQWDGLLVDELNHPIITVPATANNIDIGSWRLKGNIDSDALDLPVGVDGTMHGIAVYSADDITIGDVYGEDLLGDVLYTYGRNTSEAEMLRNLRAGVLSGSNIYRCIVALVGGEAKIEGIVQRGPIGYRELDVEPNDALATYQPVEAEIGFIRGSVVQIVSADANIVNKRVAIGLLDLDGSRIANSSTPYTNHGGPNATALSVAYCETTTIGQMRLRNYPSYPVLMTAKWRELAVGSLDFANCGGSENNLKAIFVQRNLDEDNNELPPPDGAVLKIGKVAGTLANSDAALPASAGRQLVASYGGQIRVEIAGAKVANGMIATRVTGSIAIDGEWDFGEGHGAIGLTLCDHLIVSGMKVDNAATTNGLYDCDGVTFINCEGEFGGQFDYTGLSNNITSVGTAITNASGVAVLGGEVRINNVKVLGAQGAAIADPVGGTNPDPEARAAIALILARMRASTPSIAT